MISEQTYELCGYIEYIPSSVGFVTPIFKDDEGKYCIQISSTDKQKLEWELLPIKYHKSVIDTKADNKTNLIDSFVYGFKSDGSLYFAKGKLMSEYLSQTFSSIEHRSFDLVEEFIKDWALLEPSTDHLTKEEIWERCVEFVARHSKVMSKIFHKNFIASDFNNELLILKSENESVKNLFEKQYKEQVVSHFAKGFPNFQIDLIQDTSIVVPKLPSIYFGGGEPIYPQGSFIMHTKINKFQNFDNFIVSSFNIEAYHRALSFIENKFESIITIQGFAGVGKTHLLNSIASRLIEIESNKKIGYYTILPPIEDKNKFIQTEIGRLESAADINDIIILDDVHNIYQKKDSLKRFVSILKQWSLQGKKIILSSRDQQLKIHSIDTFLENSVYIQLAEPGKEDKFKIIKAKTDSHKIQLTGRDISILSRNEQIKNITDIQKYLVWIYLGDELGYKSGDFYGARIAKNLNMQVVESSVCTYFNINMDYQPQYLSDPTLFSVKAISYFINDLIIASHRGTSFAIPGILPVVASHYSFDAMQHYLFENDDFKKTISEILNELIVKWDSEE